MSTRSTKGKSGTNSTTQLSFVPDASYADEYVNREIDGVQDFAIYDYAMDNHKNILIMGESGSGKRQPLDTPLLTPTGWTTYGEIKPGDYVVGLDGHKTKVVGVTEPSLGKTYRVTFNDGTSTLACAGHLWRVQTIKQHYTTKNFGTYTTDELARSGVIGNRGDTHFKYFLPVPEPVVFSKKDLPIAPYTFGSLLANGCFSITVLQLTTNDPEVIALAAAEGWQAKESTRKGSSVRQWYFPKSLPMLNQTGLRGVKSDGKYIPKDYLFSSIEQRKSLLAGLLDGDGGVSGNRRARYSSVSFDLANDVAHLVRSLGGIARVVRTKERDRGRIESTVWRVTLWTPFNPFRCSKKANKYHPANDWFKAIASIELEGEAMMRCIEVAAEDHLYLTEDFIVTHNTSSVLAYAAKNQIPYYSVSASAGVEETKLFGKFVPDGTGGFRWQDGSITYLFRNGGCLLLNEVNFLPPRIASALFSALDKRREIQLADHHGEVIHAHEDLLIIADMNPEYSGTHTLNAAFRNRFPIQLHFSYDPAIERQLVKSPTLLNIAKKMRESGLYDTPIGTNMLMEFEQIVPALGLSFAISSFAAHFDQDSHSAIDALFNIERAGLDKDFGIYEQVMERHGSDTDSVLDYDDLLELELSEIIDLATNTVYGYGIPKSKIGRTKSVAKIADMIITWDGNG